MAGRVNLVGLGAPGTGLPRIERGTPGADQEARASAAGGKTRPASMTIVTICHPRPPPRAAFAAALRAVALAAGATLKYSGNPVQVLLSTERPLTAAQRVAETLALEGTGLGLKCSLNSFSFAQCACNATGWRQPFRFGCPGCGAGSSRAGIAWC